MPSFVGYVQCLSPDMQTMLNLDILGEAIVGQRGDLHCVVLVDVLCQAVVQTERGTQNRTDTVHKEVTGVMGVGFMKILKTELRQEQAYGRATLTLSLFFCILTSVFFCSFLCAVYSLRLRCSFSSCTLSCVLIFVAFTIIVKLKINIYLSICYPSDCYERT